jgi:hypothetical protein
MYMRTKGLEVLEFYPRSAVGKFHGGAERGVRREMSEVWGGDLGTMA